MLPEMIPQGKIHSLVKGLFSPKTLPKVKLAGRSYFFKELEETDWGQKNFGNRTGLQNPISRDPVQVRVPHSHKMNTGQSAFVNQEIETMLQKGAIQKVSCFRRGFKQPVSGRQTRWRKEVSD